MNDFLDRARRAIADEHLHVAIGRATAQLGGRRAAAFASLPDADGVRDRARSSRLAALARLDELLEAFEARLIANGVTVHWAETAGDAHRAVLEIARRRGAQSVVKAKSMVTEEIHLNGTLEAAGIRVVETDLGEYVVQLARDRPSHIVMPIIHMTREDVGRLFAKEFDQPYTDDPEALARTARARLREEFLGADIGVSGANFGVAESGTICLVSNEGNIRMVTSLPPVHVVIMGIEKVVPTLQEVAALLRLLARSATGQKLTSYTSFIQGPRRDAAEEGPEEVHVILLDNGRSGILAGELAESLACIRCGACLNACPVYRQVGGHAYGDTYSGPIGAVFTPALRGMAGWEELPHASSLCGACRDVCPVRIDIPRMLLALRGQLAARGSAPPWLRWGMRLFAWIATRPRVYRRIRRLTAPLFGSRQAAWIRRGPPGPLRAWTATRDFPFPRRESFTERRERRDESAR